MNQLKNALLYQFDLRYPNISASNLMHTLRQISYSKVLAVLWSAGIFSLDIHSREHGNIGVLYVVSLALLINQNRRTILLFAYVSTFLLAVDLSLFFKTSENINFLPNKIIAMVAVWIVTLVLLRYKALHEKKDALRNKYVKAVEEMLFITSHKVRKPVCTIQGLAEVMERAATKEEMETIMRFIKVQADELDTCTNDLTKFIHEESVKNQ